VEDSKGNRAWWSSAANADGVPAVSQGKEHKQVPPTVMTETWHGELCGKRLFWDCGACWTRHIGLVKRFDGSWRQQSDEKRVSIAGGFCIFGLEKGKFPIQEVNGAIILTDSNGDWKLTTDSESCLRWVRDGGETVKWHRLPECPCEIPRVHVHRTHAMYDHVHSTLEAMMDRSFQEFTDVFEDMVKQTDRFSALCKKTPRAARTCPMYLQLKSETDDFQVLLCLLMQLCKPSIKPRHWKEIEELLGVNLNVTAGTLTIRDLARAGIVNFNDEVCDICESADKQFIIQQRLDAASKTWSEMQLCLDWSEADLPRIPRSFFENMKEHLNEVISACEAMIGVRHSEPFRKELQPFIEELQHAEASYVVCKRVQVRWERLKGILEWKEDRTGLFAQNDQAWRQFMLMVSKQKLAAKMLCRPEHAKVLQDIDQALYLCEESLLQETVASAEREHLNDHMIRLLLDIKDFDISELSPSVHFVEPVEQRLQLAAAHRETFERGWRTGRPDPKANLESLAQHFRNAFLVLQNTTSLEIRLPPSSSSHWYAIGCLLTNMENLQRLEINVSWGAGRILEQILSGLGSSTLLKLEKLFITCRTACNTSGGVLGIFLSKCPRLQTLLLRRMEFSSSDLAALPLLPALRHLRWFDSSSKDNDAVGHLLSKSPELQCLKLIGVELAKESFSSLGDAPLPVLEQMSVSLNLERTSTENDAASAIGKLLSKCPRLNMLDLSDLIIGNDGIQALHCGIGSAQFHDLVNLGMYMPSYGKLQGAGVVGQFLSQCPKLKNFNLVYDYTHLDIFELLTKGLGDAQLLDLVELTWPHISDDRLARSLGQFLGRVCSELPEIYVMRDGRRQPLAESGEDFAKALQDGFEDAFVAVPRQVVTLEMSPSGTTELLVNGISMSGEHVVSLRLDLESASLSQVYAAVIAQMREVRMRLSLLLPNGELWDERTSEDVKLVEFIHTYLREREAFAPAS